MEFLEFQAASKLLCYHMLLTTREPARSRAHRTLYQQRSANKWKCHMRLTYLGCFRGFKFGKGLWILSKLIMKGNKHILYVVQKAFYLRLLLFPALNKFQSPKWSCSLKPKFSLWPTESKNEALPLSLWCMCLFAISWQPDESECTWNERTKCSQLKTHMHQGRHGAVFRPHARVPKYNNHDCPKNTGERVHAIFSCEHVSFLRICAHNY